MTRRRVQPADSLELLLDTLCNTFGGVLFIAMLVVVLLQVSGGRTSSRTGRPAHAAELLELASELEILSREVESLRQHVPPDAPAPADSARVAERLARARSRLVELNRQRASRLVEASRQDNRSTAPQDAFANLQARKEHASREAEELRRKLDQERRARTRTVRAPVTHETPKRALSLELRYHRLYTIHRHGAHGEWIGANADDYLLVANQRKRIIITADPNRGMPVNPGPGLPDELEKRFELFPPRDWHIDLAVRGDSFDIFHPLSEAFNQVGYEVRIVLFQDHEGFYDRGGVDGAVQ
jgi:hypothetical protein